MKTASEMPESIYDFAYIPDFDTGQNIDSLAQIVKTEDWDYHNTQSPRSKPILHNYIKYTYSKIAKERKIVITQDELYAIWNTGLITENQEPVYMFLSKTNFQNVDQYWHFSKYVRRGERETNRFGVLPEMAQYFEDPSILVFDTRKELRVNYEHILENNFDRFPMAIKNMGKTAMQNLLNGSIDNVIERVKRNYKTAIPQYYNGAIQLLLPLCLTDVNKADLALVVERFSDVYRASTCLTLDMAYNNARQITYPDREWLQP
jgi:hypothetical protein